MAQTDILSKKDATSQTVSSPINESKENPQHVSSGVRDIEAIAQVWTRSSLIFVFVFIWLIYFLEGLLVSVQGSLLPYVVSDFASHSLLPTVGIVSAVFGGVSNFTIAKVLDVFGRPVGILFCLILATIGLIMLAACQSVELYAAAMVFSTIGNNGLQYALSIVIADMTTLRNRGLLQTFAYSPSFITCWIGGPISASFLSGAGWRWAFGLFAILLPVITLPLFTILQFNYVKAKGRELTSTIHRRGFAQKTLLHYAEFDILGVLLLSAGAALFLLPFNLYGLQPQGWASPLIICMLVFGVLLLFLFILWEKYFASITFMPYSMLSNRTIIGACILSFVLFFSFSCWSTYIGSFLQVVNELDITRASYVFNTNNMASLSSAFVAGIVIRQTGRYKPLTLYISIPLTVLGLGLLIRFERPGQDIGFTVMSIFFVAFGNGIITVTDEIAALAVVSHQEIASAVAILGFFGSAGTAVGLAVTGAIWQNVFPSKLADYLPATELPNLLAIYTDIVQQLSYPSGSEARIAIQRAYSDAQSDLLIAGTSIWAVGIIAAVMWQNKDVRKISQVAGNVA